jgi:prevent-host-death family protein
MPAESVTSVEARNKFSTLINRVAFGRERIVLTRREQKIVAIVPIDDLARLMELDQPDRTEEDRARAMFDEVRRLSGCL